MHVPLFIDSVLCSYTGLDTRTFNKYYSVLQNLQSGYVALTRPLSDQRLPYPTLEKETLLGWELRDQVLDQPMACFCINPYFLPLPLAQIKPFNSFKNYLHSHSKAFLPQLEVKIGRLV